MLDLIQSDARYVVTGGAGFIGSNIVHALVEAGASVAVIDDLSTGYLSNLADVRDRIDFVEGSVTDRDVCATALAGADFVMHQAALPSVPRSVADPLATHHTCATGTLNLLVAARDAGVKRFAYASSSSAYGNADVDAKYEGLPASPLSPYAVAKLTGEFYARVFFDVYGLETVSLRYFNIFGPRQDPGSAYSAVIPLFIGHALRGSSPTINGTGKQTRDFTFVRNAVRANLLACTRPAARVAGGVFNVGCGDRVSINELWTRICDIVGASPGAEYGPERAGDVRDSLASLERSRDDLGYEPEVGLAQGLEETVQWYSEIPAVL